MSLQVRMILTVVSAGLILLGAMAFFSTRKTAVKSPTKVEQSGK